MATDEKFVEFVLDQLHGVRGLSSRKMFGEFAIYCSGKVVALVCNNQLFVKPTAAGRQFIGVPIELPPYPGAKPSFLVSNGLDDPNWLRKLIELTAVDLPVPKLKAKRVVIKPRDRGN
jgi:TfoX/Sxy family transcriptional regulator of competence genes